MSSVFALPIRGRQLSRAVRATKKPCPSSEHKAVRTIHETKDWIRQESLNGPSPGAIRTQLTNILHSEGFIHAQRMRRFLQFVVEETLAGRASQLCEYSIGLSVFGREEAFEPGLDPIVRNDARRLRQKLAEYYRQPGNSGDGHVVIEIPKGAYVPTFQLISPPQDSNAVWQCRLTVNLTRVRDGIEICSKEYDFEGGAGFTLHLEVKVNAAGR
jgi:hypothetical protein